MNELDSLLRAAGRMMLDYQSPKVFSKGHHADFVTEADIAVQSYLVDALQKAYPHAKFLAEEEERQELISTGWFGTSMSARHSLGLEKVPRVNGLGTPPAISKAVSR